MGILPEWRNKPRAIDFAYPVFDGTALSSHSRYGASAVEGPFRTAPEEMPEARGELLF